MPDQSTIEAAEYFIKRAKPRNDHDLRALSESLLLVETTKSGTADPKELCAALRACSLKTRQEFPVITAYLEIMAEEYDHKPTLN